MRVSVRIAEEQASPPDRELEFSRRGTFAVRLAIAMLARLLADRPPHESAPSHPLHERERPSARLQPSDEYSQFCESRQGRGRVVGGVRPGTGPSADSTVDWDRSSSASGTSGPRSRSGIRSRSRSAPADPAVEKREANALSGGNLLQRRGEESCRVNSAGAENTGVVRTNSRGRARHRGTERIPPEAVTRCAATRSAA